jgi:hypothetical protein
VVYSSILILLFDLTLTYLFFNRWLKSKT